MKKHTRNLLIIIPLLPLLMGNSPAPQREEYDAFEISYKSEETHYGYNFYHFDLKNIGDGYVDYINISNATNDSYFYASSESDLICPPFDNVYFEPGFNKEVVIVTKSKIPESKSVKASAYSYFERAENVTYNGSKHIAYSVARSVVKDNYFVYNIQANYDGEIDGAYNYCAAAYFTYKGESVCVKLNNIDELSFTTNEQLDIDDLVLNDLVMLKSSEYYHYYDYGFNGGDALRAVTIFLVVFFAILGFGIFSAIFFPAMARRRRRKALLEQNNK